MCITPARHRPDPFCRSVGRDPITGSSLRRFAGGGLRFGRYVSPHHWRSWRFVSLERLRRGPVLKSTPVLPRPVPRRQRNPYLSGRGLGRWTRGPGFFVSVSALALAGLAWDGPEFPVADGLLYMRPKF